MPRAGALGCAVCFAPPRFLPVYLCRNVGCWVCQPPPCEVCHLVRSGPPRSTVHHLTGSASRRLAMSPLHPGCLSPPLLLVWMNVSLSPWLLNFHTVRFSIISGCFLVLSCCFPFCCVRRHNVSTYASILYFLFFLFRSYISCHIIVVPVLL